MTVNRIVPNIATEKLDKAKAFYSDVLGLRMVMDLGWIVTFAAESETAPQISFASVGGSETRVPDLSIEVDNLDEVYERVCESHYRVEYGPAQEPWGVRRFYVRDPFGRLVNIMCHN
ncbi:MAG TPA: VOC family protein [Micropepsaceae bacterium]|nr:VOC family protein [Micropepsaceae bacterium]